MILQTGTSKAPSASRRGFSISRGIGRLFRRYTGDRRGVTAIEFGVVAMPFLVLVFGIFEIGLAFFVNRLVDNAVFESSRLIRTGQAHQNGFNEAAFKADICEKLTDFLCNMDRFVVDVRTFNDFEAVGDIPSLIDDGEVSDDLNFELGGANDIVVARVVYRWPMLTALMHLDSGDSSTERLLVASAVFRNEPFPWGG